MLTNARPDTASPSPLEGEGRGGGDRCSRWIAGSIVTLSLFFQAPLASAAYVTFHQVFGDWAVTCWRNEANGRSDCALSAPPPRLERAPISVVQVTEPISGGFALTVEAREATATGATVSLQVDAGSVLQAPLGADYVARWTSTDAGPVVAEMLEGKTIRVTSPAPGSGAPQEEVLSLQDFGQAFEVLRVNLRQRGIIRDR